MGKRGPAPKPDALKKAQGTFRPSREASGPSAEVTPGAPPTPKTLKGVAARRWKEIVPELHRIGALAIIDGGAVEAYCRSFARWTLLEDMSEMAPIGDAATEARKLHKEVIQPLELALGLHYAARSRVKHPEKEKPADPTEDFLFGQGLKALQGGKATEAPPATPKSKDDTSH